jgi:4-amino-4-deoxy-L-arabinose transferase-like glycosyltransferase
LFRIFPVGLTRPVFDRNMCGVIADPARSRATTERAVGWDLRECLIVVLVVAGAITSVLTESLSAISALRASAIGLGWAAAVATGMVVVFRRGLGGRIMLRSLPRAPGLEIAMLAWLTVVAGLTLITALFGVPTTPDSMYYHLARVAHWAQSGHVGFFPTHTLRQLFSPPWAEYAILHLYLAFDGDYLANLVQWIAMIGSVVGSSLIARDLGAGPRGQILAAFVCATIPMGILQASSTQNDYVGALWLTCLTYAGMAARSHHGAGWIWIAGVSLGLAYLTKGTSYVYAIPLLAYLFLFEQPKAIGKRFRSAIIIFGVAILLNAPHYARNVKTFGGILGPGGEGDAYTFRNTELSMPLFTSNLVRNLALHVGTPSRLVNRGLEKGIEAFHRWLGVAADDSRNTWPGTRLVVDKPIPQEDSSGNGRHLLLMLVATAAALGSWRRPGKPRIAAYAAIPIVGLLLFSLLFKWQPWHSRLHLALFVLGAPLVGVVLEQLNPRALGLMVLTSAVASVPFLVLNGDRPLLGDRSVLKLTRVEQRRQYTEGPWPEYLQAVKAVVSTRCATVGLMTEQPEYMGRALFRDAGHRPHIEHVLVSNPSRQTAEQAGFYPCAIMEFVFGQPTIGTSDDSMRDDVRIGATLYRTAWRQAGARVLLKTETP